MTRRTSDFGRKGGSSPTKGAKALTFRFTYPDGTPGSKKSFDRAIRLAVGYNGQIFAAVYQHNGTWYVAGLTVHQSRRGEFPLHTFVPAFPS